MRLTLPAGVVLVMSLAPFLDTRLRLFCPPPHQPLLAFFGAYFPIQSGIMEVLEDCFHPGAGGDAELLQVVAAKGGPDIAEPGEEGLDVPAGYRGIGG